jgi:ribosome-associated protein
MNENKELNAALALYKVIDERFGKDIVLMDLRGLTPIADFFLIVTGSSSPQLTALADTAEETLAKHGIFIKHREGVNSANWILLDFSDIVVHIFDKESREYYNLERTWADAKILKP